MIVFILLLNSCKKDIPEPNQAPQDDTGKEKMDVLDMIYTIADKNDMKVMGDVNLAAYVAKGYDNGYTVKGADSMVIAVKAYIDQYHARYGQHKSFWGWYLDWEVNPIKPTDAAKNAFWRKVWKSATDECHRIHPGSMVTIAPFFLIDQAHYPSLYMPPSDYVTEWSETLKETGIDILMMQESGAQHASFFTLAQREPYYAAFAEACKQAGTQFWADMESGQVHAKDWAELDEINKNNEVDAHYEFTPIDWLSQKLSLAARYCEGIVNWGYFPYMNPILDTGPWPANGNGDPEEAYDAYKAYYEKVPLSVATGNTCRPVMRGTLWWVSANYDSWSKDEMEQVLEHQISLQKAIGFDILWITNTARNITWTEDK